MKLYISHLNISANFSVFKDYARSCFLSKGLFCGVTEANYYTLATLALY